MESYTSIILMHKNIPVAEYNIDPDTGRIVSKINVLEKEHLPLPVQFNLVNDFTAVDAMQNWVAYRSIPHSRSNFNNFLENYSVSTPSAAAYKSLGLNLSDQYWYKPKNIDIDWKDVNLFKNPFLKQSFQSNTYLNGSIISPDSNSNGELPKFWCIEGERRLLYKQGSGPLLQQPYNEQFAAKLLERIGLKHVDYECIHIHDKPYSVCETFINSNTEYIPAIDILMAKKKSNNENAYQHFFSCIHELEINITKCDINNMLVFDNIINNIDRHYGNFGYIRNAETLEFIEFAPIFDSGNSLWYNVSDSEIITRNQPAKPFKSTQEKQIKLVENSSLLLFDADSTFIEELSCEVFNPAVKYGRLTEKRVESIARNVSYAIQIAKKNQDKKQVYCHGI